MCKRKAERGKEVVRDFVEHTCDQALLRSHQRGAQAGPARLGALSLLKPRNSFTKHISRLLLSRRTLLQGHIWLLKRHFHQNQGAVVWQRVQQKGANGLRSISGP